MEWGAFSLVFLLLFSAMTMAASSKLPLVGFKVEFVKHDIPTEMMGGHGLGQRYDQECQF